MKQWFGGNDAGTSPSYFTGSEIYHLDAFNAVLKMLRWLEKGKHIQLIYIDDESKRKVVAYRFTSDKAYNLFYSKLRRVGISLGHGCWNPFGDKHQFKEFFEGKTNESEAARKAAV